MKKRLFNGIWLLVVLVISFTITCLNIINERDVNDYQAFNLNKENNNNPYIYTNPPDITNLVNISEIISSYYKFRNSTLYQAIETWESLTLNLEDFYGGYNTSTEGEQRKKLSVNTEAAITLINLYKINYSNNYLSKAENLTKYIINNFWNESLDLFITSVNRTGDLPSNISYTSENSLVINLLYSLFQFTKNMSYIEIIDKNIKGMNNTLWDHEYGGYFNSNNHTSLEEKKLLYDNAYAMFINLNINNKVTTSKKEGK